MDAAFASGVWHYTPQIPKGLFFFVHYITTHKYHGRKTFHIRIQKGPEHQPEVEKRGYYFGE